MPTSAPAQTASPSSAPPSTDCAGLTGLEALEEDPRAVRPGEYEWDPAHADTRAFEDCAALSAVVLPIVGPTASSPYQVSLYHEGRFIGHATENDFGFAPRVERVSDDTLRITYTYSRRTEQGAETTAGASGSAVLVLSYDPATGEVRRSGEVPPGYPLEEEVPQAPEGGGSTGGSPATAAAADSSGVGMMVEGSLVFHSPTRNIGCAITEDEAECGVRSILEGSRGSSSRELVPWTIRVEADGTVATADREDAPFYEYTQTEDAVLEYGESISHAGFTCTSSEDGMRCVDDGTGHGFRAARTVLDPL